jgi:hypothetical protein
VGRTNEAQGVFYVEADEGELNKHQIAEFVRAGRLAYFACERKENRGLPMDN